MTQRPQRFLTRQAAAAELLVTPRTVDRLVAAGDLIKVRTSANRSGITLESLEAYLAGQPTSEPSQPLSAFATPRQTLLVILANPPGDAGQTLDAALAQRVPGCVLQLQGALVVIRWPVALGYSPETVYATIEAARLKVDDEMTRELVRAVGG